MCVQSKTLWLLFFSGFNRCIFEPLQDTCSLSERGPIEHLHHVKTKRCKLKSAHDDRQISQLSNKLTWFWSQRVSQILLLNDKEKLELFFRGKYLSSLTQFDSCWFRFREMCWWIIHCWIVSSLHWFTNLNGWHSYWFGRISTFIYENISECAIKSTLQLHTWWSLPHFSFHWLRLKFFFLKQTRQTWCVFVCMCACLWISVCSVRRALVLRLSAENSPFATSWNLVLLLCRSLKKNSDTDLSLIPLVLAKSNVRPCYITQSVQTRQCYVDWIKPCSQPPD